MNRTSFQLPIWSLLALILVAAFDCAVFRLPLAGRPLPLIMVLLGGVPMANILVLGPLLAMRKFVTTSLSFWAGFEIAGVLVLLFYGASTIHHAQDLRDVVLGILRMLGTPGLLAFPAAAVVVLLPQIFAASLGGLLSQFVSQFMVLQERPTRNLLGLRHPATSRQGLGSRTP